MKFSTEASQLAELERDDEPSSGTALEKKQKASSKSEGSKKPQKRQGYLALISTVLLAIASLSLFVYPTAAQWFNSYNQSLITSKYHDAVQDSSPTGSEQLAAAAEYNSLLSAGAEFAPLANVATGNGELASIEDSYWEQLVTPSGGPMSRIQIDKINVDLPIYHGTSEQTLLNGAGHLQGTSLPIGGAPSHSVITAHRGLADARMFTDLDKIEVDDTFVVTTFDRVLSYRVVEIQIVDPADTASLRQVEGKDLVTLVTCTPLGVNSDRILVTAERTTPTPPEDLLLADSDQQLGFPWWAVITVLIVLLIAAYAVNRARSIKRYNARIAQRTDLAQKSADQAQNTDETRDADQTERPDQAERTPSHDADLTGHDDTSEASDQSPEALEGSTRVD